MARIGILTCSSCTQDTNCASVKSLFRNEMKELLCPKLNVARDMNDLIQGTLKTRSSSDHG